jgi:hypothetical protein
LEKWKFLKAQFSVEKEDVFCSLDKEVLKEAF